MFGAGYLLEMLRHSEKRPGRSENVTSPKEKITDGKTEESPTSPKTEKLTSIVVSNAAIISSDLLSSDISSIEASATVIEFESSSSQRPETILSNDSAERTSENNPESCNFRVDYDFQKVPSLLLKESAAFSSKDVRYWNNYLKGCKWSPDGSCLLTNSEDKQLRIFTLPAAYYESTFVDMTTSEVDQEPLNLLSTTSAGELVYDYCWYPLMNSSTRESCVFAYSSRDHPIHLCDAISGRLCATYSPINHLDEVTCAYSIAFSPDGGRLYSGFNKVLRMFDTYQPGRQISTIPTWRKSQGGQSGIISCITVSSTTPNLFACGSYSRSVALYSDTSDSGPLSTMEAEEMGGVTQVLFHPNGTYLYSGGRMDSRIICWDTRIPGRILATYKREAMTNQRFHFDLDQSGRYLVSGGSNGEIQIWDTTTFVNDESAQPICAFRAHSTAANGVSMNRYLPIMATSGGQRIFGMPLHSSPNDVDSDSDNDNNLLPQVHELDNSLKLWRVGKLSKG